MPHVDASFDTGTPDRSRSILIVDDEPQVLAALADLLEDDFDVIAKSSPAAALEVAAHEASIAVIISDQRMPQMSGDEFLTRARNVSRATRVLITGYADLEAVVRAVNDGKIFGYVSKPWDPEGVRIAIHKAAEFYELNSELAQEQALLRDLMQHSTDAIYFKDKELRYTRLNEAKAALLGIDDPAHAVGRRTAEFVSAARAGQRYDEETALLETGMPVTDRIERVRMPDGVVRWYSENKVPIRDASDTVTGLLGISRDVTALKQTEEELECILDLTQAISNVDEIDRALDEMISRICGFTTWDYGEAWLYNHHAGVLENAGVFGGEKKGLDEFKAICMQHRVKGGEGIVGRAWAAGKAQWSPDLHAISGIARYDAAIAAGLQAAFSVPIAWNGEVLAVLCFFLGEVRADEHRWRGLTVHAVRQLGQLFARKKAEAALREREEQYKSLIDQSPFAVLLHVDRRIVLSNGTAAELFGFGGQDQLLGRDILDLVHPDDRARFARQLEPEGAGERAAEYLELRFLRVDGETFVAEEVAKDVAWEGGSATQSVIRDVTDQRAMAAQLQQAQKMEAVGQLTGGVAHDFNNLLTVVQGNLELLVDKLQGSPDQALLKLADRAQHAAQRGADLTSRLLAFSRRQVLEPTIVDVNEAVRGLKGMLARTLGEHIEIRLELGRDVGHVRVDAAQLETALLNLSVNARDAMSDRGGQLTIETSVIELDESYTASHIDVAPGSFVLVSVSDTGCGMEKEVLEHAIEPFFTTKETGKGTGLGLSMVYGFMKQSGGHAAVYSEVGHGTTVRLYFSRVDADGSPRADRRGTVLPDRGGHETVLVVEDDDDVREMIETMLELLGYDVFTASRAADALSFLETTRVDLLISDVVMPGGTNGFELVAKVREAWPEVRVLLTSGYAESAWRGRADGDVKVNWLAKPYTRTELAEKVRAALGEGTD